MKSISIEQRVLNSVNQVINKSDDVCVCISVETQTVVKLVHVDDTIQVYFLEPDGLWEDAMTIHHISDRNRRLIARMILALDI